MTSYFGRYLLGAALARVVQSAHATDFADEAFLEFLGSFEDGEGNWLDPSELMQIEAAEDAVNQARPRRVRDDEDKTESDDDDTTDNN